MIQNIWAVGRNYSEHIKELGNELPKEPIVFLKAGSSALGPTERLRYPDFFTDLNYEVELAVQLGPNLKPDKACVAIDFTRRELQNQLKAKGLPWTRAKSFIASTAYGPFFTFDKLSDLENLPLKLWVNGQLKQDGNTSQMIFSLEEILAFMKQELPLVPGDLILTGTPSGVGAAPLGCRIAVEITGRSRAEWLIEANHE